MQRLTGIGVSPGVVAGRAVILIQRAQVLRYQIAPERVEHELSRLEESRGRSRAQLNEILSTLARKRPIYRVSVEWDGQFLKPNEGNYPISVGLYDGERAPTKRTIAFGDPHGGWLEWRG